MSNIRDSNLAAARVTLAALPLAAAAAPKSTELVLALAGLLDGDIHGSELLAAVSMYSAGMTALREDQAHREVPDELAERRAARQAGQDD